LRDDKGDWGEPTTNLPFQAMDHSANNRIKVYVSWRRILQYAPQTTLPVCSAR